MIEDNLSFLLFVLVVTGVVQYALVRKLVSSIADPLFYFIIVSAFSLALGCLAVDDSWLLVRTFMYFLCFYMGFILACGRHKIVGQPLQMNRDLRHFRAIVIVLTIVFLGLNAVIWMKSGSIAFADSPSLQKFTAYEGGFGFVRRFNWSVGVFVLIASLYWLFWERSVVSAVALVSAVLISVQGGGKSALLPAFFAIGLFIAHPFYTSRQTSIDSRLRSIIPVFLAAVSIPVFMVLFFENGSVLGAFDAFVERMFYFGDVLLYWGQQEVRTQFSTLGPFDYLLNVFGGVLGALRLTDYANPIGNQFVQSTLSPGVELPESVGPNLTFYVRGELFFGPFFALLHAFSMGFIFGLVRRIFLNYRGRSLLKYSLLSFAVVVSVTLPTEEGLVISQIFDFAIFFLPVYFVIAYLIFPQSSIRETLHK